MVSTEKWFHVNIQCKKHGEGDWIVKDNNEHDARASISALVNCPDCTREMSCREITEGEAHSQVFGNFFASSPSLMAVCLYS